MSCTHFTLPPIASRQMCLYLVLAIAALIVSSEAHSQCVDADCTAVSCPDHSGVIAAALRPRWVAVGSVVAMDRVNQDPRTLMQSTTSTGEQLNAADINFDWQLGFDVSLTRRAWDDTAFEVRYLDLGQLDGNVLIPVTNSQVEIITDPPVFVPNVQGIAARFTTDFFSFETNYYYPAYDFLDVLIGFRYVSFDDDIFALLDAAPDTVQMVSSTSNEMYGCQIGAVTRPCRPALGCLWLSAYAKTGLYGNDAQNRGVIDTGLSRLAVNDSADDTSFMGEFGATSRTPIGNRISIFASYSLIWLESVAIASEQIAVSDYFNGVGSTSRGNAVFYGATAGVELRF